MDDGKLTRERLPTAEAILTLGALVIRSLQEHGRVSLYINRDDQVEIIPPGELELDSIPEEEAINMLVERGSSEDDIVSYLKGREDRDRMPR